MSSGRLPLVALVGRTNAGKSTLFNRLVGEQKAVVDPTPGVTRDPLFGTVRTARGSFLLVDTGGLDVEEGEIETKVREQTELALAEADGIVLVVDGRVGLRAGDEEIARRVRRSGKPVWLAVNKIDTPGLDSHVADFYALGLEPVFAISAAHGRGVRELAEAIAERLGGGGPEVEPGQEASVRVAVLGRPNVGKSSLVNRILGQERVLVSSVPGTTRDTVDIRLESGGRSFLLLDTAGVRRRARIDARLERVVSLRSLRALERSEVVLVVVDAEEGCTEQDARLASYAWRHGRALVLVVNKCDLVGGILSARKRSEDWVARFPWLRDVPFLFVSARTGEGTERLLPEVSSVAERYRAEIPTRLLNTVLGKATRDVSHPSVRGRRPSFFYAVQTGKEPPRVSVFSSAPELVRAEYARYLLRRLREAFDLSGVPIQLEFRPRSRARSKGQRPGRETAKSVAGKG
ncbi:MAG: GTPase Der [Candidatus Binatia bacterium]|nr:MAG: GTPase Der [Candidatus Binatia bacterium]